MTAKVLASAIQKGGTGKSTTSGITAYMLSQSSRVLVLDLDSQGNVTELLTGLDLETFRNETILEAIKEGDIRPYVKQITPNLHIVPSDNFLATFSRWLFTEKSKTSRRDVHPALMLKEAIQPVLEFYDYIIVDTPPALGEETINALAAADFVIVPFETSKYSFTALKNFFGTLEAVVEGGINPDVQIAGILRSIIDNRRKDAKGLIELVEERYGDYCHIFETIITRSAHVGRLSIEGFIDNPELPRVLADYEPFVKELLERVN